MDIKKQMDLAKEFSGRGDCYIHTEMKGGKKPQTVLCGDTIAMLWGLQAEIARIAELTGTPFEGVMNLIMFNYKVGYENINEVTKDDVYRDIEGSMAEWIHKKETELAELDAKREESNSKLREEIRQLKMSLKQSRTAKAESEKMLNKTIQRLEKENLKLDHENDRLVKIIQGKEK